MAQQLPLSHEERLEDLAVTETADIDDGQYLEELQEFRNNPINLNSANRDELRQFGLFGLITEIQLNQLIAYRELLGNLIDLYELQAVPGWDLSTIRKLLPYICIKSSRPDLFEKGKLIQRGMQSLLTRVSQNIESSKSNLLPGNPDKKYLGSPQAILVRYRFSYKNLVRWGFTAEKDAGEKFFQRGRSGGLEFYSFHFFTAGRGILKSLAIGDFTVNMGQGLIQWQGLSFRKSADANAINKQSPFIRPYTSAGEFYFFRGLAITLKKKRFESSVFISAHKTDANLFVDSSNQSSFITSFLTSGYHRTPAELNKKKNIRQWVMGNNITWSGKQGSVGINFIYWQFSNPIQKRNEPYNLYSIQGNSFLNSSVDYRYTYRNLHFFGEFAIDGLWNKAILNGLMLSMDSRVDLALLHRSIDPSYQSINASAFTENTLPVNENGIYAGITFRPAGAWKVDAYADMFHFPWLKFTADFPSDGSEFLLQVKYSPSKQWEVYSRFRKEIKMVNEMVEGSAAHVVSTTIKENWRTHLQYKVNRNLSFRGRIELVWFKRNGGEKQEGFLSLFDVLYKPMSKPYSLTARFQYFETGGYEARVYAYENDVMYAYNVPSFSGKGFRYYLVAGYDLSPKWSLWMKLGRTEPVDDRLLNSSSTVAFDEHRTDLRFQIRYIFR